MKLKQAFLAVMLVGITFPAFAQHTEMKWGKIDQQDLEMKVYAADTAAEAVILGDYGEVYFTYNNEKGFQLNVKHHMRIKILKSAGLDWANLEIPLYKSVVNKEKILSIKGAAYNLVNGKVEVTKMSKDSKFKEGASERVDIMKYTVPNVKEGTVLEYEYLKLSDFVYELETWVFQSTIPCRWSELDLRVPEYFTYKHFLGGYHQPKINESKPVNGHINGLNFKQTNYRWVMADLPALKHENYVTSLTDYASKMEFELKYVQFPNGILKSFSTDWETLSKKFLEDSRFGGELKKQRQTADLVAKLTAGKTKQEEKVNSLYTYLQQHVKYNGSERVYASKNFKETLEKKAGSAAEINLLLVAMLREAGLTANPVIISTRSHGQVNPVIPLEKNFNYVICQLSLEGGGTMLLDATEVFLPAGMLPYRCMNGQGRLIAENATDWVLLLNKEKYQNSITAKLSLSKEGVMTGTLSNMSDGYTAVSTRKELFQDGEDKYLEKKAGVKTNWTIQELKFTNQDNINEKLEELVKLEIRDKAMVAGDKMYVSLLPEGVEEQNPFKMDTRLYPVNFGCPTEKMLMYEIELPQGYAVEQLPQTAVVTLPDKSAIFRYNVAQMGNKLSVTSIMHIKKPMYMPEEYEHLKQFYQLMLSKQNEQVVLRKEN